MSDLERWLYLDGPEPERVRVLLDQLDALRPPSEQDTDRMARDFLERLDAALSPPAAEPARDAGPDGPLPEPRVRPLTLARPDADDGDEKVEPPRALPLPPPPPPAVVAPPSPLAGTALDLHAGPRKAALPFKLPSEVPPARRSAARTEKVPVMPSRLGETAPLGDGAIAKAVAALPFASSSAAPAVVPLPTLTVEQYAALRATLALWPASAREILPRYNVPSLAALAALDDHWRQQVAHDPQIRTTFDHAYAWYEHYLRQPAR